MGKNFFLKNTLLLASLSGTGLVQAQQQPNIILFLVDDMGWQDTSVPFYQEPLYQVFWCHASGDGRQKHHERACPEKEQRASHCRQQRDKHVEHCTFH